MTIKEPVDGTIGAPGLAPPLRLPGWPFQWPRFGLAARSAAWTILLGTAMAGIIAFYMHVGAVGTLTANAQSSLASTVATSAERVLLSLQRVTRDVEFLTAVPPVYGLVEGNAHWQGEISVPPSFWRDRLAETFTAMLRGQPRYVQLRLIGAADGGREIVRVDRLADGAIRRTPQSELQRKGDRPYFREAIALPPGATYVSPIELNQEHGRIEVPHRPVVRAALPVFAKSGEAFGIVIMNVDAQWLFDRVGSQGEGSTNWMMTNSEGDYLLAPDATKTFGFDLEQRFRIQDDFPELAGLFDGTASAYSGFVQSGGKRFLAAARRLDFDDGNPDRFLVVAGLEPEDELLREINLQRRNVILLSLALVLAGGVVAVAMARAVVRPLRRIAVAAGEIAAGRGGVDLGEFDTRNDEPGDLARTFSIMARQIGEREARLVAQTRELSRSNQELAQFAYVASHDLQEPLRMIGSYLELLQRRLGDRLDEEACEYIGFAVDGATRMKQLINDLLNYSRAGYRELKREPVEMSEIVANVLRVLDAQIVAAGAKIEIGPLPRLRVDAIQIERVLMNLVENALKYRSEEPPAVHIGAERIDGGWKIAVADNGIGIDERFREKVFEIFRRLHGRDKYSGTGIGLAVVKLAVERHGGTVRVDPAPGGGSIFSFTLKDAIAKA